MKIELFWIIFFSYFIVKGSQNSEPATTSLECYFCESDNNGACAFGAGYERISCKDTVRSGDLQDILIPESTPRYHAYKCIVINTKQNNEEKLIRTCGIYTEKIPSACEYLRQSDEFVIQNCDECETNVCNDWMMERNFPDGSNNIKAASYMLVFPFLYLVKFFLK